MSSFKTGELVKQIRERKKWQQKELLFDSSACADITLSRIENNRQKPNQDNFFLLMEQLKMPIKQIIYAYLENQTMDIYLLRDQLINCLEKDVIDAKAQLAAKKMINQLKRQAGFDEGLNQQFFLSCKAKLYEKLGSRTTYVLNLIDKGLSITFPEFDEDNFGGEMLLFEEIELLHTKSLLLSRLGDHRQAIKLLYFVQKGLSKLPEDDYEKEKKLSAVLLTLAQLLIEVSDFADALTVCEAGFTVAKESNKGREIAEFLYLKALCLFHLGQKKQCRDLLYQAYFGFSILQMGKQAEKVRENAKAIFGIKIETYGADAIVSQKDPIFQPTDRGVPMACKDMGTLLARLRMESGLSLKELSQGICNYTTLNRIENGKVQANVYYLEAFFQKLGRDINLYANTFLSAKEFEEKQIRNEIMSKLAVLQYKEAEELILILEKKNSYQSGINLQFIEKSRASIIYAKEGSSINLFNKIMEALYITKPDFNELKIRQYRLMFYEIQLVNLLAAYYCENGQLSHGVKIFEQLRESINNTYVDEMEKIRTYPMVLYNYSKFLGIMKRYDEALEIIAEGENLDKKHKRINTLNGFAINKACDYLELGRKEESIPYFAQAYYCYGMMGEKAAQKLIQDYAKERLGLKFR
ncbi:MAG: helix-turn-helix domain-containing protein [Lachnospiraceae bacterium]|nr:helix-turn-helix domain-containing protein [Lachnospiraceae bacterium]